MHTKEYSEEIEMVLAVVATLWPPQGPLHP